MSLSNLVEGNKLPVLFIGSGFSRRYLNAPDWENLLINLYEFIGKDKMDYSTLKSKLKNKKENRQLSDGELFAIIAEEIEEEFNTYFYESELVRTYSQWIEDGVNPFRMCIAMKLGQLNILSEKQNEIDIFKNLKNKIMSIVTTNYDNLIENLFSLTSDNTFIGQPQLFNPNSMELGELFKIHGCISDPDNIIISASDYANFKENAKLFSAKLLTLISENPVVFIGYSLNDPNIQQTLTDLVRCLSNEQIRSLQNHFYLVEYNEGESELIEKEYLFKAKSYNGEETVFPISVISTDNYTAFYAKLAQLTPSMNINTVKQVKRIVKDIVVQSVETNKQSNPVMAIFMDDVNKLKDSEQKFAIAVGNVKDIYSTYGYTLRPIEDVLEDVLFDNKNISSKKIIQETYEKSYFKIKRILPIYKYVNRLSEEELSQCKNVQEYIKKYSKKEDFLNRQLIRSVENMESNRNISSIIPDDITDSNYRRTYWSIIKNIDILPLEKISEVLRDEFLGYQNFNNNRKSDFRRLVSIYDFYKYGPNRK